MELQRPRPVAEQVNEILRERIRAQQYGPGERLPPESELARELGVSRATLRTALAKLAAEGLILRKQGDGTFVNERLESVNTSLGGMLDFWRLIRASGYQPSIQTVSISERPATEREAAVLALEAGDTVVSLARLFLADGKPVILAMNVVPKALFLEEAGFYDGRLPLHQFLRRYCRKEVEFAVYDIHSTISEGPAAEFLEQPSNRPLLLLTTTFYDKANQPLAHGQSYYNDAMMGLRFVQTWA